MTCARSIFARAVAVVVGMLATLSIAAASAPLPFHTLSGHGGEIRGVAWLSNNELLSVGFESDSPIRVWRFPVGSDGKINNDVTGDLQYPFRGSASGSLGLARSSAKRAFITGDVDLMARVWAAPVLGNSKKLAPASGSAAINRVAVEPSGLVGFVDGSSVKTWAVSGATANQVDTHDPAAATAVAFLDPKTVVSSGAEQVVSIQFAADDACRLGLNTAGPISALAAGSGSSRRIAAAVGKSGGADVLVWSLSGPVFKAAAAPAASFAMRWATSVDGKVWALRNPTIRSTFTIRKA